MTLVSNNIKYLRKLNGLTQEQFARRIGIKRSLLGAYEEARANPNYNNLVSMAKAFNTTVDTLLKQDLQRIRQTPELSLPLQNIGHPVTRDTTLPPVFREAELPTADASTGSRSPLIRDPVAPDSAGEGPQPQPLASVLEKYYREPTLREPMLREPTRRGPAFGDTMPPDPGNAEPRPVEPSLRESGSAVAEARPASDRLDWERPAPAIRAVSQRIIPRPVSLKNGVTFPPVSAPADRAARPTEQHRPVSTPERPLAFNNRYEQSAPTQPARDEQATQPAIPLVQQFQFGEYQQRYQQPDYLSRLPTLRLPTLPAGHYRAFEADADFSTPGALLIGQFVRNWFDIADGRLYVLLIQGQGPVGRRIFNQVKIKGTLLLTADRPTVPSREVALKDVLEVWEIKALVSQQLPEPSPNLDRLRQLTDELRFEVERLK